MKQSVKPRCRHGCRFVPVTDTISVCPHTAYGSGTYQTTGASPNDTGEASV